LSFGASEKRRFVRPCLIDIVRNYAFRAGEIVQICRKHVISGSSSGRGRYSRRYETRLNVARALSINREFGLSICVCHLLSSTAPNDSTPTARNYAASQALRPSRYLDHENESSIGAFALLLGSAKLAMFASRSSSKKFCFDPGASGCRRGFLRSDCCLIRSSDRDR